PTKGTYIEGEVYDDGGDPQGTVVLWVKRLFAPGETGRTLHGDVVTATDPYYRWWLASPDGAVTTVDGAYHICKGPPAECKGGTGEHVVHLGKWRQWKEEELVDNTGGILDEDTHGHAQAYFKRVPKEGPGAGGAGDLPWDDPGDDEEDGEEEKGKSAPGPSGKEKAAMKRTTERKGSEEELVKKKKRLTELARDLKALKAEVKAAEVTEEEKKGEMRGSALKDDSESDFQKAPAGMTLFLKLQRYAQRHPGRLAARLLHTMGVAGRVPVGALRQKGKSILKNIEANAVSYYNVALVPNLKAKWTPRSGRELKYLTILLDLLVENKSAQAADIIAQRIKALEKSVQDNNSWVRARFLELVEPDDVALLDRGEEAMIQKELEREEKLRGPSEWKGKGHWKGKGEHEFGAKGQGRCREEVDGGALANRIPAEPSEPPDPRGELQRKRKSEKDVESPEGEVASSEEYEIEEEALNRLWKKHRQKFERKMAGFLAEERDALEVAWHVLENAGHLRTKFGRFRTTLGQKATAQDAPEGPDLLPISLDALELRRDIQSEVRAWVILMAWALNFLYCTGWEQPRHMDHPGKLTTAQTKMVDQHLVPAVRRMCPKGLKIPSYQKLKEQLQKKGYGYDGSSWVVMEDLAADKVIPCWPNKGEAAVQPITKFLHGDTKEMVNKPLLTILPAEEWPETVPQSYVRASDAEWERLVAEGYQLGLFQPCPEEEILRSPSGEMILNGAGAVPKEKNGKILQRFISILCPLNAVSRKIEGDESTLPYVGQVFHYFGSKPTSKVAKDDAYDEVLVCGVCRTELTDETARGEDLACPAMCGCKLCSLECCLRHAPYCPHQAVGVPLFSERYSGPEARLSRTMFKAGFRVVDPIDYKWDSTMDVFTERGKEWWAHADASDPTLEHHAPDSKTFSRARGRPYQFAGKWYEGPVALRDESHVMGFTYLAAHEAAAVRKGNKMAMRSIARCRTLHEEGRFFTLDHPRRSWMWYTKPAIDLAGLPGVRMAIFSHCCYGGRRKKWTSLLTNSETIYQALHKPVCPHGDGEDYPPYWDQQLGQVVFPMEQEATYPWGLCEEYAKAAVNLMNLSEHREKALAEVRKVKIREDLMKYDRLQSPGLQEKVVSGILHMERTMQIGFEKAHLQQLLRLGHYRGTDVRLAVEEQGGRQLFPYPAYRWLWRDVLSFRWRQEGHINELEFQAFLAHIRRVLREPDMRHKRVFVVVDSQVMPKAPQTLRYAGQAIPMPANVVLALAGAALEVREHALVEEFAGTLALLWPLKGSETRHFTKETLQSASPEFRRLEPVQSNHGDDETRRTTELLGVASDPRLP
ncbi:unnamed protein product, partial [Durusdinium trenchii]